MGARALSYLSFFDTYVGTAGFENGTARVPWDPGRAQILLLDEEHRFVNTPMDRSWRMWRYLVCNNTREFVDMAMAMVHAQMRCGADGIFVDNADVRLPCHGHGVRVGYADDYRMVCTAMPTAETIAPGTTRSEDPSIRRLPRHTHIYPDKSHEYALARLLRKVRRAVRQYGRDKVVLVNGTKHASHVDGAMLESFVFSWTWTGRSQDWAQIKELAAKWEPYLHRGGAILALSYLGRTRRSVVEDALFACAAARLCGFIWSDAGTGAGATCAAIRRLDLGARITDVTAQGRADYAIFDKGIVIVNGGSRARAVTVRPPQRFRHPAVRDLAGDRQILSKNGVLRFVVPAHAGRVYIGIGRCRT